MRPLHQRDFFEPSTQPEDRSRVDRLPNRVGEPALSPARGREWDSSFHAAGTAASALHSTGQWHLRELADSSRTQVSLTHLLERCQEGQLRIPAESGAYLVLELCEAVLDRPVRVELREAYLSSDGLVAIDPAAIRVSDTESAASLQQILLRLLVAAGPESIDELLDIVDLERRRTIGLRTLRNALEGALVPLNRAASRRVLARFARESFVGSAVRPLPKQASSSPWLQPGQESVNAELDALLHLNIDAAVPTAGSRDPDELLPDLNIPRSAAIALRTEASLLRAESIVRQGHESMVEASLAVSGASPWAELLAASSPPMEAALYPRRVRLLGKASRRQRSTSLRPWKGLAARWNPLRNLPLLKPATGHRTALRQRKKVRFVVHLGIIFAISTAVGVLVGSLLRSR